jgi:hypothetical protein
MPLPRHSPVCKQQRTLPEYRSSSLPLSLSVSHYPGVFICLGLQNLETGRLPAVLSIRAALKGILDMVLEDVSYWLGVDK